MSKNFEETFQNIVSNSTKSVGEIVGLLEDLITEIYSDLATVEENSNIFEAVLVALLEKYVLLSAQDKYKELLSHLRLYFLNVPKARTAKLVRIIIQSLRKVPDSLILQVELCTEWIEWSKNEERTLLRQRLETELSEIYFEQKKYREALEILSRLSSELRKVDHKSQLIEVYLIESRIYRGLGDFNRAKASLTAARTNAAAVYTTPILQGQLDLESGIIFNDEGEYKTAISYFTEALDSFANSGDPRAIDALKYGLLCRILDGKASECSAIAANYAMVISGKGQNEHPHSNEIEAMLELAKASEAKSLHQLKEVRESRSADLETDPVVRSSIDHLVESMAEQHLLRIVKPYSSVELSRISEMIRLPIEDVLDRLVHMILDQKLKASINQTEMILNIFEEEENNQLFTQSLELIDKMDEVVDALYQRCHLMN